MTKLLIAIDRRARYLDRAFPKSALPQRGPMVAVELPCEPWAERYQEIRAIPESLLPNIEKIYGAEARLRNESPVVTLLRYAANAGGAV